MAVKKNPTRRRRPSVIVLDDSASAVKAVRAHIGSSCDVDAVEEAQLKLSEFPECDLVLVDFDLTNWKVAQESALSLLQSPTGVGLGHNVIEFTEGKSLDTAPLVVLFSGKAEIRTDFAPSLCQQIELDWVLGKSDPTVKPSLRALAGWRNATEIAPMLLTSTPFAGDEWLDFLRVPKHTRQRECVRLSLEGTERPQATRTRRSPRRIVAAWLLQRLIGYPSPLWSISYLCARLELDVWKRQDAATRKKLHSLFASCRYKGPLAGASDERWWKALVEAEIDVLSEGGANNPDRLRSHLKKLLPTARLASNGPAVVVVDESGRPTGDAIGLKDAVQVAPVGWPANADPAFMVWDDVRDVPDLQRLVAPFAKRAEESTDA